MRDVCRGKLFGRSVNRAEDPLLCLIGDSKQERSFCFVGFSKRNSSVSYRALLIFVDHGTLLSRMLAVQKSARNQTCLLSLILRRGLNSEPIATGEAPRWVIPCSQAAERQLPTHRVLKTLGGSLPRSPKPGRLQRALDCKMLMGRTCKDSVAGSAKKGVQRHIVRCCRVGQFNAFFIQRNGVGI